MTRDWPAHDSNCVTVKPVPGISLRDTTLLIQPRTDKRSAQVIHYFSQTAAKIQLSFGGEVAMIMTLAPARLAHDDTIDCVFLSWHHPLHTAPLFPLSFGIIVDLLSKCESNINKCFSFK